MKELINIAVPFQTFNDLSEFLDGRRSSEEFAEVAGRAISEWIAMQNIISNDDSASLRGGYQWKSLFLPSGTKIRVAIRHEIHRATVEGDHILHQGAEVSPAQLVNQLAGCTRNAWKHIWLLLPWRNALAIGRNIAYLIHHAGQVGMKKPAPPRGGRRFVFRPGKA